MNLVLKPGLLKLPQKVSQAGAFIPYVMVVFDNHLPDRLSLPAGKQVTENAMFRTLHIQFEKVNRPTK